MLIKERENHSWAFELEEECVAEFEDVFKVGTSKLDILIEKFPTLNIPLAN